MDPNLHRCLRERHRDERNNRDERLKRDEIPERMRESTEKMKRKK